MNEYKSSGEFITKLETKNYKIGSFDVFLDKSKALLETYCPDSTDELLKKLPTTLRASIVDKKSNDYVGFISTIDMNNQNGYTSILLETNQELKNEELEEILEEYKNFLFNDLGISQIKVLIVVNGKQIKQEHKDIISKSIQPKSENLKIGIEDQEKSRFKEMGYNIPNLSLPCTLIDSNQTIGIIGLTNLIWSNRRANLQMFFNKEISDDFIQEFAPKVINEYLQYLHDSNLYSVSMSVSGSNKKMLDVITNSNMNYYASIPYAASYEDKVETNYLFENYPDMIKENEIYLPENKIIRNEPIIEQRLSEVINLKNGFFALVPAAFEKRNIDINKVVKGHIEAMQNRNEFSIPVGEDKYMIQEGNGKYGMSKAVQNYSYILFDNNLNYSGYINILRQNAKNAEVEMGIKPELQNLGLGTALLTGFSEELFDKGYMSVTGSVFDFNTPSKRMCEKIAKFSGKRIGGYYINGKLWDMNMYTKENESEFKIHK